MTVKQSYVIGVDSAGVRYSGQVSLSRKKNLVCRAIQTCGIEGASQVGHKHAIPGYVECESYALHQMCKNNFWFDRKRHCVHGRPAHCIASWRIAAVGPVEDAMHEIEIEIDWLRELVEQEFDIAT
jgi:hypothetical protein